jgi:hypothetical protein
MASYKPEVGSPLTRKTPLSTSPTKEWTQITRKKEANAPSQGVRTCRAIFPEPSPSKEDREKKRHHASSLLPRHPLHQGRLDSAPVSDDEPTMQGEEPPQREARRWRNRCRNMRRHHEAGEQDPAQPVS